MALDKSVIEGMAERLRTAGETRIAIGPLRDQLPDVAAAIAVQQANTAYWVANGRRLIGRKIGLTSKVVQQQLGVDQPDYGMLFADMLVADGDEVPLSKVMQPKVEGEIALVLKKDLVGVDLTLSDVVAAVDYAVAAIEIVDSRIEKWNIKIQDTIADNASSGLFVLGKERRSIEGLDLPACEMSMLRKGEKVSQGNGAACLGNPLNAALWLARTMVEIGAPLKAGDAIMSGALGPMVGVSPGDTVEVQITGLGSVRTRFGV
ncbi:MAG: fumarylacetoacetate hydrolase family protein [Burkholderiales bacterium]